MATFGQQKLLSYQYLPITQITLHTEEQIKSLKHKSIVPDTIVECNNKMLQYFRQTTQQNIQGQKKEGKTQTQNTSKIDFKKWAKEVDKICGNHVKLNEIQKIQLFNNTVMKIITSEPQLVLILSKLHALPAKDRKSLLEKCTFQ